MASSSSDSEIKYAVLMETNGKELESWYYFIRHTGNEAALQHLSDQLDLVEWYILDDLSTFDIDLDNLVSERTAKEMTYLCLNAVSGHRKFDGKMEMIDFGFKPKDSNDKKIVRCFKKIGIGRLDDYVEDEDFPDIDIEEGSDDGSDSSGTEYEYGLSDSDELESSEEEIEEERPRHGKKGTSSSNPSQSTVDKIKEEIKAKKAAKEALEKEKEKAKQKAKDDEKKKRDDKKKK